MRFAIAGVVTFVALMGALAFLDYEGGWRGWLRQTLWTSGVFLFATVTAFAIVSPLFLLWWWAL